MSLISRLPKIRGEYRENYPLSKINWFGVGGNAEILFRPLDLEDLSLFLTQKPLDIAVTILGVGSNVIIRDGGIDGVVIKLGRNFSHIELLPEKNEIKVGAAVLNYNLAQYCLQHNISGYEFLVGIPGSVGGGIAMNAGSYGREFKDIIKAITALDEQGQVHYIDNRDIGFCYRSQTLPENMYFMEAIMHYQDNQIPRDEIKAKMDEITAKRLKSQPVKTATSGSTFKNPTNYNAWKLIDKAGMRGVKQGGAQVSELHCNFLINTGDATAADLESLGEEIIEKVYDNSGIKLDWEIKRIGKY